MHKAPQPAPNRRPDGSIDPAIKKPEPPPAPPECGVKCRSDCLCRPDPAYPADQLRPTVPFWEAVGLVRAKKPDMDAWTWVEWLSILDLSDTLCCHPVRFRMSGGIESVRILDYPWLYKQVREASADNPFFTHCPVCDTKCPAPPVNVRKKRAQR